MVFVIIWHRLDNIHSKGNLMLYAMDNNQQKISLWKGCNIKKGLTRCWNVFVLVTLV